MMSWKSREEGAQNGGNISQCGMLLTEQVQGAHTWQVQVCQENQFNMTSTGRGKEGEGGRKESVGKG